MNPIEQVVLAVLAVSVIGLAVMTNLWLSARDDVAICKTNHENAVKQAQAETLKAQLISKRTNDELEKSIPKLVAQAQAGAVENYQRRYGRLARPDASGGVGDGSSLGNGIHADGLRVDTSDSAGTASPDGAKVAASQSLVVDACDPRFIADAAQAAVIIDGWLTWAKANQLPFER